MANILLKDAKRKDLSMLYNTGTEESPEWAVVGFGIPSGAVAYNNEITSETFINGVTKATISDAAPVFSGSTKLLLGARTFIEDILLPAKQTRTKSADIDLLLVSGYMGESAALYAERYIGSTVIIVDEGGDGGKDLEMSIEIHFAGKYVAGATNGISPDDGVPIVFTPAS